MEQYGKDSIHLRDKTCESKEKRKKNKVVEQFSLPQVKLKMMELSFPLFSMTFCSIMENKG